MNIEASEIKVRRIKVPYGRAEIIKYGRVLLIIIVTFLLCLGIYPEPDIHHDENPESKIYVEKPSNLADITITAIPNYTGASTEINPE